MFKKYDIIYSLGGNCACAMYLKKANLRLTSGPFDWLMKPDFAARCDLILNEFDGFLNFEDFKPLLKTKDMCDDKNCDYFQNVRTGFWFLHDFPVNVDIKQSFPAFKLKYERRINRFYQNMVQKKHILLIWFSWDTPVSDDVLESCHKKLCSKFGKDIDLVVIENNDELPTVNRKLIGNHIEIWRGNIKEFDENGHLVLLGKENLCLNLFKRYKLSLKNKVSLKRLWGWLLIKLVGLVPVRDVRHRLRHKIRLEIYG